jgi:hypothetical protein
MTAGDRVLHGVPGHAATWRASTAYAVAHPLPDPERDANDTTTSWPVVLMLLLLVPPLGWLQLTHRHELDTRLRWGIAAIATVLVAAAWATALHLQPWD